MPEDKFCSIDGDVAITRTAHCCCGALRVDTTGDPIVVLCHCRESQRRTGAPFGVGAYFRKEQVRRVGREKGARLRYRAEATPCISVRNGTKTRLHTPRMWGKLPANSASDGLGHLRGFFGIFCSNLSLTPSR